MNHIHNLSIESFFLLHLLHISGLSTDNNKGCIFGTICNVCGHSSQSLIQVISREYTALYTRVDVCLQISCLGSWSVSVKHSGGQSTMVYAQRSCWARCLGNKINIDPYLLDNERQYCLQIKDVAGVHLRGGGSIKARRDATPSNTWGKPCIWMQQKLQANRIIHVSKVIV